MDDFWSQFQLFLSRVHRDLIVDIIHRVPPVHQKCHLCRAENGAQLALNQGQIHPFDPYLFIYNHYATDEQPRDLGKYLRLELTQVNPVFVFIGHRSALNDDAAGRDTGKDEMGLDRPVRVDKSAIVTLSDGQNHQIISRINII